MEVLNRLQNDSEYYESACALSWKGHEFYHKDHVLSMWEVFYNRISDERLTLSNTQDSSDQRVS